MSKTEIKKVRLLRSDGVLLFAEIIRKRVKPRPFFCSAKWCFVGGYFYVNETNWSLGNVLRLFLKNMINSSVFLLPSVSPVGFFNHSPTGELIRLNFTEVLI